MKRIFVWASPLIGVMLGMAGILIFRNQLPADANVLRSPERVQQTRPDNARLNEPQVELADQPEEPVVAGKR